MHVGSGRMCSVGPRTLSQFVLVLVLFWFCSGVVRAADNATSSEAFLERCREECAIAKSMVTCGKYRAMKLIHVVLNEEEFGFGPFKIIRIPAIQNARFLPEVPRLKTSSLAETMYFIREAAEDLFTRRALMYTVDQPPGARSFGSGLMVLDDDELGNMRETRTIGVSKWDFRLFKKKKNIILPVLILLNLLKIKLLILPIFLGVHMIKKLLVLGSLLLPSILSHLKICKVAQHSYHHLHPWASSEYPYEYSGGYGHEDAWDHRNDVGADGGHGAYQNYYNSAMYNPLAYYLQHYNKQQ